MKIADHIVRSLTRCNVAFIPRDAIRQIAFKRSALGEAMRLHAPVAGSHSWEWIANVGGRDASMRVAHLLCELGLRLEAAGLGEHTGSELAMLQGQIADCTGLTPVHVNCTLTGLDRDGSSPAPSVP